jgi:hypothetical protein
MRYHSVKPLNAIVTFSLAFPLDTTNISSTVNVLFSAKKTACPDLGNAKKNALKKRANWPAFLYTTVQFSTGNNCSN